MRDKSSFDDFIISHVYMSKKSRREVNEYMMRRPYYGTKLDKELKDAKDRARAHRRGDDRCSDRDHRPFDEDV